MVGVALDPALELGGRDQNELAGDDHFELGLDTALEVVEAEPERRRRLTTGERVARDWLHRARRRLRHGAPSELTAHGAGLVEDSLAGAICRPVTCRRQLRPSLEGARGVTPLR